MLYEVIISSSNSYSSDTPNAPWRSAAESALPRFDATDVLRLVDVVVAQQGEVVHQSLMQTTSRMKSKGYDVEEIISITSLSAEVIEGL